MTEPTSRWSCVRRHWRPVLLALVVLVLFGRSITYGFVNWDDPTYLQNNAAIQSFSADHLAEILIPGEMPRERLYIPVTYLTLLAESTLFGFHPQVIHAGNLLLHLLNTLLVYALLQLWLGRGATRLGPLLGALIFAIHPVQVESVAWAMGRKEVLSTALALAALIAWHRWLRHPRRWLLAALLIAATLAMLAKPTLIVLPALLALTAWGAEPHRLGRRGWAVVIGVGVLALLVLLINRQVDAAASAEAAGARLALLQGAYLPAVLVRWLGRLLLLQPVSHFYPLESLTPAAISLAYVVPLLLILGALALAVRHRRPSLWLGPLFAAVALLPSLSILLLRNRYFLTADRYGYFPLVGLVLLVAAVAPLLQGRERAVYAGVVSGLLVIAGWQAWHYTGVWSDSRRLWSHALAVHPDHPIAHNALANALVEAGDFDAAKAHFRHAARLRADYAFPRYNLAMLQADAEPARVEQLLRHATIADPTYAPAWHQLGVLHSEAGDTTAAMDAYNRALAADPTYAESWYNRALLHQAADDLATAQADMERAVALRPGWATAHFKLATYHHRQSRAEPALAHYAEAVRLDPAHHQAWYNYGLLLQAIGRPAEATTAFKHAYRLNPRDPDYRQAAGVDAVP